MRRLSKLLLLSTSILALNASCTYSVNALKTQEQLDKIAYQDFIKKVEKLNPIRTYFDKEDRLIKEYDINSDKKSDFLLGYCYYKIEEKGELKLILDKDPVHYGFDLNRNGFLSDDEKIIDVEKDGINGNEVNCEDIKQEAKEKEDEKKREFYEEWCEALI